MTHPFFESVTEREEWQATQRRLRDAAPELLEALVDCAAVLEGSAHVATLDKAYNAIKKAEGEVK